MTFSKLKTMKEERGFTIVELLIVIVIIAILAAIVIVAYNGIQNRARTSAAQSTAQTVQQKLEAYNAEVGNYPATWSLMTADSTKSYYVNGVTLKASGNPGSSDSTATFSLYSCTGGGFKVNTYNWNTPGTDSIYVGPASSSSTCTTQIAS